MSIADTLTGFASSLRARLDSINTSLAGKGQTAAGSLAEIPAKIDAIETGADVSGVTAAEGDVLSPKVFVDSSGEPKTGTIITKSASDLTTSGASVVVPAGYYPDEVSKSVATAVQATPSISVSSSGLITASATQSAGYVSSGTKSASKQLSTKSATTYTPSTSNQTISSGYYLTGTQTIQGDSNLVASNIKSGVSIFGVSGSYVGGEYLYYLITNCSVSTAGELRVPVSDDIYGAQYVEKINIICSGTVLTGLAFVCTDVYNPAPGTSTNWYGVQFSKGATAIPVMYYMFETIDGNKYMCIYSNYTPYLPVGETYSVEIIRKIT